MTMKFIITLVLNKSDAEGEKFLKLTKPLGESFTLEGKFLVKDYLITLGEELEVSCLLIEDKGGK